MLDICSIKTIILNISAPHYPTNGMSMCLVILNPAARMQIDQFAKSAMELFKLVLGGEAWGTGFIGVGRVLGWRVEGQKGACASREGKWESPNFLIGRC